MARGGGRISFDVRGSKELLKELNKLPKDVLMELRVKNLQDGQALKQKLQAAPSKTPQQELVQKAIYARKDRVIRVEIGGRKRVGRQYQRRKAGGRNWKAPAGLLAYGSEYGSSGKSQDKAGRDMGPRFKYSSSKKGYWMRPTVDKYVPELKDKWERRVNYLIRRKGF
jgi:hypothetical protein